MNIVLFEIREWSRPLAAADVRAAHLTGILKLRPRRPVSRPVKSAAASGTLRFGGVVDGTVVVEDPIWTDDPPKPSRVVLIVGTPRPPTARRLLKDLTTLGAAELHFAATDLGDKSYSQSNLWKGEFETALREGAAQARTTLLPRVERHPSLRRALAAAVRESASRVCFDEGGVPWDQHTVHHSFRLGHPVAGPRPRTRLERRRTHPPRRPRLAARRSRSPNATDRNRLRTGLGHRGP